MDSAPEVLEKYWDGSLPVDPFALARRAGVEVVEGGWNLLEEGYSGKYDQIAGECRITYDATDPKVRQRFTVAHELGHHFLNHGTRPRDGRQTFSARNYDPIEAEANHFAAALLMPRELVAVYVKKGMDLSALAKAFGVSEVAMEIRLKNLGYLRG